MSRTAGEGKRPSSDNRELMQLIKCFGLEQPNEEGEAGRDTLDSVEDVETLESFYRRLKGGKS